MSKLESFKDTLLFEAQKEFYDERGRGARYRMTLAGVSYFKNEIKDWSLDAVAKYLKDNGFVQDIKAEDEGISVKLTVKGCCLKPITEGFTKLGKEPLSCPIGNVFMYALEVAGSNPPEMIPVEFKDGACIVKMAKIYTSEIVGG